METIIVNFNSIDEVINTINFDKDNIEETIKSISNILLKRKDIENDKKINISDSAFFYKNKRIIRECAERLSGFPKRFKRFQQVTYNEKINFILCAAVISDIEILDIKFENKMSDTKIMIEGKIISYTSFINRCLKKLFLSNKSEYIKLINSGEIKFDEIIFKMKVNKLLNKLKNK